MARRKRTKWSAAGKTSGEGVELAPGQLTTNFWESEVGKSNTAERRGINNDPPEDVLARAKLLAEKVLQPIRDEFGAFSPESWYRCETLERLLTSKGYGVWCRKHNVSPSAGWAKYFSLKSHPKGEAADIEVAGLDNLVLFDWIQNNLQYDQLILEGYRAGVRNSGWIHISYRETGNRNQAFGIPEA